MPPVGFVAPFWGMKASSDKDETNMEIHVQNELPIARNCDKIDAGDELILYVPAVAKVPDPLQPAPKRQRT